MNQKVSDYLVYYYKEELYVLIPHQAAPHSFNSHVTPTRATMKPLFNVLKNERYVRNKENLMKECEISLAEAKNWNMQYAGKFFDYGSFGEESADSNFSFSPEFLNPFVDQPTDFKDCFICKRTGVYDVTIVPFSTVSYYQIYYTNGEISGLGLVTKTNAMVTIDYKKHEDFVEAINAFNGWRSRYYAIKN